MKPVKDDTYHKIPLKKRVRLKDDRADVYKMAHAGSEGIIADRAIDEVGDFPMVYIKWDHGDWRYNGESDMWTFEDHFEPVEENVSEDKKVSIKDLIQAISSLAEDNSETETKEIPVKKQRPDTSFPPISTPDEFIEGLSKASEAASESEAFVVLTIRPISTSRDSNEKILVPEIFVQYGSEHSAYALQLAVSSLSEAFHQEAISQIVSQKKKNES